MRIAIVVFRYFLSLRYSVKISGTEVFNKNKPCFVLPNHQALVDPMIVFSHLRKYIFIVPVADENYFKIPLVGSIIRSFGSIPVSDLSIKNRDTSVLDTISVNVLKGLNEGKSVLLYPSGQIAGQGYEKIFNKQSAYEITKNAPDNVKIIALRISGLWGSMWSRAWEGRSPGFLKTFLKAVFLIFANLLFFLPRRKVTMEFIDVTNEAKEMSCRTRVVFNNYLESIYNKNGEEPVLFLKHYFYVPALKRKLPEKIEGSWDDVQNIEDSDNTEIPDEIFKQVVKIIVSETGLSEGSIKIDSNINLDLNIDSIALVTIITSIEDKFSVISQTEITQIRSVEDLCVIATGKGAHVEKLKPSNLNTHIASIKRIEVDKSKTIPAAFLKVFNSYTKESFSYDKMLGSTTRKEFLLKVFVVSKIIQKEVKGSYVGIMLPALQSTSLLVMATYIAGKIPVMLNWTVGKKVLDHCVESAGVTIILTAKTFHDKVADLLSDEVKKKCVFFEQKVKELSLLTKLKGLFNFHFQTTPKIVLNDVAVVLFTSGSETLPKAVYLTHKNIVSDLNGVFKLININTDKIFLGFLPPFHSFGFTVLTILPLISGVKVAYTPDPTDSREVLKILKHTKANTILGTPTFLKMLLSVSVYKDFKNVNLAISGAESLDPAIMKSFYEKAGENAKLLEGYGITECSPVLTINPMEKQKEKSVGKFIVGVDYLIADLKLYFPVDQKKEGMIMVKGENVFSGYRDKKIESPFVEIKGEKYYKTGDLGYIDEEGFLFITGRLKRFIKVAGEMISLPAIENTLLKKYGSEERVVLAVEGNDTIQPVQVALFSVLPIDITEANLFLKENGFSSLVKIHNFYKVDEIPLLGIGKTDYKVLKEMIK